MFSRLYLGVHSPADIVTGGILGGLLLSLYLQIDDQASTAVSNFGLFMLLDRRFCVSKRRRTNTILLDSGYFLDVNFPVP